MNTLYANSPDGTRIAYDRSGMGPAIVLLHGGGGTRQEWHEAGYVRRLRDHYTVIAVDLRGHGESGLRTDPADYSTDKMGQDILAVADACAVERFVMWGMSYGGKVSRYLAARSERVVKFVMIGTPLGPGVSGERRQQALDFCAHWPPIVQAQRDGTLDLDSLSHDDRDVLCRLNVPAMEERVQAIREAMRVLRRGGKLFAAFITRFAPFRVVATRDPSWLVENPGYARQLLETGIHDRPTQFARAYYVRPDEVAPLMEGCGLSTLRLVGCEGVVAGHEDKVNELTGEAWEAWVDLNYQLGQDPTLYGAADHMLYVGEKSG